MKLDTVMQFASQCRRCGSATRQTPLKRMLMSSFGTLTEFDRKVLLASALTVVVLLAAHLSIGPNELQLGHIDLGKKILEGSPGRHPSPAYPMPAYAALSAFFGPWRLVVTSLAGLAALAWLLSLLDTAGTRPSLLVYGGVVSYAAMITSWNDHALWLCILVCIVASYIKLGTSSFRSGALAGLLWGALYHVRSDAFLLIVIFTVLHMLLRLIARRRINYRFHAAAFAVFFMLFVPWGLYTKSTIGKISIGTTNGWAVIYLGLGLVPNNRYGLEHMDEFAADAARAIGEPTPWSSRSGDFFRDEVRKIVIGDPAYVLQRIVWGFHYFIRGGVYLPDIRKAVSRTSADYAHLLNVSQDVRQAVGLHKELHPKELAEARGPRPIRATTFFDVTVCVVNFLLAQALKLVFIWALLRMLVMMVLKWNRWIADAPSVLAAAVLTHALIAACFILPTVRLSSIVFILAVFAVIRWQSCDREPAGQRSHARKT